MDEWSGNMKVLIIGGTYFCGKAFLEFCEQCGDEVTVLNRGTRKLEHNADGHIREIVVDRKDVASLAKVKAEGSLDGIQAVVDFCAYEAGDIQKVMQILPQSVTQYIMISTCDVYYRGTGKVLDETAALETRDFGGEAGAYITGKVALEKELREQAAERGIHITSVRPAFIYGPYNYAPREGIFFQWIAKAGQVLFPMDADGSFQVVYVKDLARFLHLCLLHERAYDEAFNVCGDQIDYEKFVQALERAVGNSIERVELPVAVVQEKGIPLPFPLTKEESESYDGSKARSLGAEFTELSEGLKESYAWFLNS
jgi:nucleoside-diphosphate-sugar epimerase